MQPLISVIVPVYKVEAYLDRCVASIVSQTYQNLEIILVDDGSPDHSGAICDQWAAKDPRIKVIHKENGGGGSARNAALDIAQGDFIAFVDSDDYLCSCMLEQLLEYMASDVDLVECDYVSFDKADAHFVPEVKATVSYSPAEAMRSHIEDRFFRQLLWNKLYRSCILDGVRFPEGKGIDDEFFTYQAIGNAGKLVRIDAVLYAYRQQAASVMHTLTVPQRLRSVDAKVQRHAYIKERFPDLAELSSKDLWFTCLYQGQITMRLEALQVVSETVPYLQEMLAAHPIKHINCSAKERFWLTLSAVSFKTTCRIRNFLKIGL